MKTIIALASLTGVIVLAAGCNLTKPYPAKQTYLLEAPRPAPAATATNDALLEISPFTVAAPFERLSFVYRLSGLNYETDFYHQFLAPPAVLINNQTRQWLDAAGLAGTVLNPNSKLAPTHILEGNVTELFADLHDPKSPQAVLAIQFTLSAARRGDAPVQFHKAYRQMLPLKDTAPETIAAAWSRALAAILNGLEGDLKQQAWNEKSAPH